MLLALGHFNVINNVESFNEFEDISELNLIFSQHVVRFQGVVRTLVVCGNLPSSVYFVHM